MAGPRKNLEAVAFELEPSDLATERALSIAIEDSLRALLAELIDFDFAFGQLEQVGQRLAAGEVRLRWVVDVSASFEAEAEESANDDAVTAAVRNTAAAITRLARLRARAKGRAGLIEELEALSIHPRQLRQIGAAVDELQAAMTSTEQSLLEQLRAAGHEPGARPESVAGWRRAARPLSLHQKKHQLRVLAEIEAKVGTTLARFREQAVALRRAHAGVENAKSRMMDAHAGLVRTLAARYRNQGLERADLLQEGTIGLMRAVERFDHRRGVRFSTYARWWIRQGITRAIADQARTVRVPVHVSEQLKQLRQASARLAQKLGREPSNEEIAEAVGLSTEKVAKGLRNPPATLSLDAPLGADNDATLIDLVPDVNAVDPMLEAERSQLGEKLDAVLSGLPEKEQTVLRLRFGVGVSQLDSLAEIGQVLGVTRERARQIETRALARLQRRSRALFSVVPVGGRHPHLVRTKADEPHHSGGKVRPVERRQPIAHGVHR